MVTRVVSLRREAYDVYIGRAGKGLDGYFGNPYMVGRHCSRCGEVHETGASTLPCFDAYFLGRLGSDAEYRRRVLELTGKTLGCFCAPNPCHGNVIAAFLNRPRQAIDAQLDRLVRISTIAAHRR